MNSLIKIWNSILSKFIDENLSENEVFIINLVNKVCFIGVLFSLVNAILFIAKNATTSVYISFSFLAFLSSLLLLNYLKKYELVKASLIFIVSIFVSFIYLTYGSEIEILPIFFIIIIFAIIIYDDSLKKFLAISYNVFLIVAIKIYILNYGTLKQEVITLDSALTFIIFGIIGFLFLINALQGKYKKLLKQNSEIVKNLEQLNKKYATSQKELKNVNLSLDKKNQELEQFVFIASHDLKAPVRNILSFSTLLQKALKRTNEIEQMKFVNFIKESGFKMQALIESILTFGKVNKASSGHFKHIDLNKIIKEISNSLIENNAKKIKIFCEDLPLFLGYEIQLEQLFKNLIENGLKYNISEIPTIKIWCEIQEEKFIIKVKDNGIGIKKDYIKSVFKMFKRLHNSSEFEGTGIGLAICEKIVEMHNGSIKIESELNKGSTFILKFPASAINIKNFEDENVETNQQALNSFVSGI